MRPALWLHVVVVDLSWTLSITVIHHAIHHHRHRVPFTATPPFVILAF